ncbi:hypothetical protein DET50_1217 [Marinobacter pelagius]|uniref:Uncharacterized protein n=1 Tax=Marinobacter pelagius TaxID=379482 RepID=A0A366GID6_9GAMM|nr:hypothetical protein [Marinobacter pelagius]RBP25665.1 hypothetical protein DET50_1217 [Marinobacter pelagius]
MTEISLQAVFNRAFTYLRASGVEMTVERYRTLLHLIEESVASVGEGGQGDELLELVMERIAGYFDLPETIPPKANPELCRGSIGYGRDV